MGLNGYKVSDNQMPLGELVNEAWEQPTEAQRTMTVFAVAPALLSFEDQVTCEMIDFSYEWTDLIPEVSNESEAQADFAKFVQRNWPLLKKAAADLAERGQNLRGRMLIHAIGLSEVVRPKKEALDAIRAANKFLDEQDAKQS